MRNIDSRTILIVNIGDDNNTNSYNTIFHGNDGYNDNGDVKKKEPRIMRPLVNGGADKWKLVLELDSLN